MKLKTPEEIMAYDQGVIDTKKKIIEAIYAYANTKENEEYDYDTHPGVTMTLEFIEAVLDKIYP